MNKYLLLSVIFILATSCHAQKEKLGLNLSVNEKYTQKTVFTSSIVQTINGEQSKTTMSNGGKISFKVLSAQDATYELEVKFINLWLKMNLPNRILEFNTDEYNENNIFLTVMKTIIGKPVNITMSKTGKVNKVINYENLWSNMFDKLPQLNKTKREQIRNQLEQAFSEKALKGNLEMVTAIFPDHTISKGDKWHINTQLEAGMSANIKTIYELKKVSESYCFISGTAKIETLDKDAYIKSNGMTLKYDLKGNMTSEIKINRKSGWVIEAKIIQTIKGKVHVKDNPQMLNGMIIPMTMTNEMRITE